MFNIIVITYELSDHYGNTKGVTGIIYKRSEYNCCNRGIRIYRTINNSFAVL